jgi:transposase
MSQLTRIGVDTSKAVFTLHGVDAADRPVLRINLRRAQMIPFFRKLPPAVVAMEACGSAYYWARELAALGHTVRLVPPQYVKPYVKRGKNDRNDAAAICEAAGRPGMHFVPAKTVEQQAAGMVLKARDTLVGQRTALINTVRGHAAEFGIVAAKGAAKVHELFSAIEHRSDIPPVAKEMFVLLRQQINDINARIAELDVKLNASQQGQSGQPAPGHHPGRGADHRVDAGHRD